MNATLPGSSLKDFSRVLSCFSKVGDEVSLEVRPGKLLLSTLNASKSVFILVTLNATRFEKFEFLPPRTTAQLRPTTSEENTLRCKLQLRSLLSIFRPRNIDNKDSKDASVEKCELKLLHPSDDASECQLLLRLVCKHGIRKTYKLQYEQSQTMHAVTDRTICQNRFVISARALKDVVDHFAPRAEELTLAVNDGNLLLTSFTEGVTSDKEILKQPIHTSITIDRQEFDVMEVDEQVQITFGLREFKSLSVLCDLLGTDLSVMYSEAGKPLLVDFERDGILGEFVVATTADGERVSRRTPMPGMQNRQYDQYRPRTVSAGTRAAERQASEHGSTHEDTNLAWQNNIGKSQENQHRNLSSTSLPRRSTASETAAFSPNPATSGQSALFALDPDLDDPEVMARRSRLENTERTAHGTNTYVFDGNGDPQYESEQQFSHHAQYDDDDEMMLYADESNFEQEEPLGPTQTPATYKPKGLFD